MKTVYIERHVAAISLVTQYLTENIDSNLEDDLFTHLLIKENKQVDNHSLENYLFLSLCYKEILNLFDNLINYIVLNLNVFNVSLIGVVHIRFLNDLTIAVVVKNVTFNSSRNEPKKLAVKLKPDCRANKWFRHYLQSRSDGSYGMELSE